MDRNKIITDIVNYVKEILEIDVKCEYVDIPEEDGSFYKVIVPENYRVFKDNIAIDLLNKFDGENIVCVLE